jgi:hypothetical protein
MIIVMSRQRIDYICTLVTYMAELQVIITFEIFLSGPP